MSLVLRVFLFGCISFLAYGSLPFDRVAAQQAGNWCTALPPVGSGNSACASNPYDACQAQHDGYAPTFPFEGYTDTYRWDVKQCAWAIHAGQGILPAQVGVNCPSGQVAVLPGNCIPQEEVTPVIVPNDNCGSFNNGGGVSMESAYPIDILRGAKLFRATDFSTADGSLKLERLFNSRGYVGTHGYMRAAPLGLGSVWHFAFQHELQFNNSFGDQVEFESADGGSYPFSRNSAGVMTPVNISYGFIQQTDYTLELVGPWPSNIDDILTASTQWKVHDPHGSTWTFQSFYDAVSGKYRIARPIEVVFQGGRQWTFTYGSYNELSSVKDGYGKTISFTWRLRDFSAMGGSITPTEIATAGLPDGTTLKYLYDSSSSNTSSIDYTDRLIGVQHLDASNNILDSTSYLHGDTSVPFNVTGILDNQGTLRWTVQYDANGHAITSTGPNNAFTTSVSYGTADEPATTRTVTNALGKSATYTYNWGTWNVYLQSIDGAASTNCPASTKSWSYSSGFISSTTDEEGRVTSYTRNAIGQPTQIVDGYGTAGARTISLTWDPNFRQPTEVVQPGLTTDFALNALGQLTKVTQTDTTSQTAPYSTAGQTRTWIYTYDSYGSLLTVDGPLAGTVDTVAYTYNPSGYLATVTNEVGQVTTISAVNGRGLPTTLVDANGVTSNLTYDSEGRLATVTVDPTGLAAVTSLSHNAVGDITKVTRPNGAYLQYTYDDARRITEVQDNSGSTVKYTRDNLGNVTGRQITDAGGTLQLSQTAVFDELGRLLKFVGASSQTWVHAHDRTDNLISITDPRSNVFGWTFDSVNRLIGTTDEEGNQVGLSRNGKDEITGYSDPRSLSTSFVRNGFGEVIQRTSPDTGTTVYTYDALGKPIQITDGRGVVTNLTYDNAGRLLSKQYPAGPSENISYSWDATAGGNKGVGRVTKIQDASGAVEWTYNSLGQVTQEKKTTSSVVYTVGYAYDLDGNVTQMTYPSGRIINYYRGSNGLVTTLTEQP